MSEAAEAKWYVVHTYSGYENKVKDNVLMSAKNRGFEDRILDVVVPEETVVEYKNGKANESSRKLLPGYVLVNMALDDDSWYIVRNTRGVTGFVGPGSKPVPLTEEEVEALGISRSSVVVDYAVGDIVEVVSGAWIEKTGVIKAVKPSKETATIAIDLIGREIPVELSFKEIRHI